MTRLNVLDPSRHQRGGYRVDVSRGGLSLSELNAAVRAVPSGALPVKLRARRSGWKQAAIMRSG